MSPCSTTTGRCGARSRCRSSSTSSSGAGGRWRSTTRRCASASRSRRPTRATTRWLERRDHQALPGRRQRPEAADRRASSQAFDGDEPSRTYDAAAAAFLADGRAPDAAAARTATCAYQPMVELLRYLEANGFTTLHRLRRRPRLHAPRSPEPVYGIPPERVIGSELRPRVPRATTAAAPSSTRARSTSSTTARRSRSRIWSRIGRRPALAVRQLQRRHPDAAVRRQPRVAPAARRPRRRASASSPTTAGAETALEQAGRRAGSTSA